MKKIISGLSAFTLSFLIIPIALVFADVGPNLVTNPSFESGTTAPTGWSKVTGNTGNKSTFTYLTTGFEGVRSARIDVTTYKGGDIFWQPTNAPVTAGKQYQFTGYSKNSAPVTVIATYLNSAGKAVSYATLGTIPANTAWTVFTSTLTIPSTVTQVRIQHVIRAVGYLEVDAYYLGLVGSTPPPPPPPVPQPKPTISSFTANPGTIISGSSSQLSFVVSNASTTSINQGVGVISGLSVTVAPILTTTYTLTVTNPVGSVTATATVIVNQPPPPPSAVWDAMVTLSFDDSWISQYTVALPIMQTAGIKGTFYMTTEPIIEGWDDFMTVAQVKDIATKGHEIAGHTITHPNLTQLSQVDVLREIVDSKSYLEGMTGKTVTTLAYPYGEFNSTTKTLAKSAGYLTARGVDEDSLNIATTDKFNLHSSCIEKNTPFATIKQAIDDAKSKKQWYIICIHEVKNGGDQYSITPAQFQQIVDYIKLSGIKTVTVKEGSSLMAN